nr:NADH-quinone oxidoreductase subunit N [Desulfobulbaceae bacterium]
MKLMLFAPELLLLLGSLLIFLFSLSDSDGKNAKNASIAVGAGAAILLFTGLNNSGDLFLGAYRVDLFSQLFKLMICLGMTAVLIFGRELKDIDLEVRPEYYLFLILSSLGLMMLVSSIELITLFVALELSSFSLYILVPMRSENHGVRSQMEAAAKYILFGVTATGIMLFGMSYLFGITGTTYFVQMVPKLAELITEPAAIAGIAMVMCGFLFKLAVFPFHFWVPDVYEGASNETTAFIASIPKLGAVAILIRVVMMAAPDGTAIVDMMVVLAICSMFYGNLSALVQTDIKRMLGFSGIAHAGFVLLGLLTFKELGYATSMYYIFGYLVMNLACFLVICKVSKSGENVTVKDLTGLHKRSPVLAFTMAVGMLALAGIPPFVGFMGKFMLLAGALKAGQLTLVILAALNTAIAIFYYLSVVKVAYCDNPEGHSDLDVDFATKALSVVLVIAIIVMGVMPTQVLAIATSAVQSIM